MTHLNCEPQCTTHDPRLICNSIVTPMHLSVHNINIERYTFNYSSLQSSVNLDAYGGNFNKELSYRRDSARQSLCHIVVSSKSLRELTGAGAQELTEQSNIRGHARSLRDLLYLIGPLKELSKGLDCCAKNKNRSSSRYELTKFFTRARAPRAALHHEQLSIRS